VTWIVSLFGLIVNAVIKFWQNRGQPLPVQEGEKAGALGQALQQETDANAEITKTSQDVDKLNTAISTPAGLRQYEANDPDNLDSGKA